jgi:hypothetical protein
VVELRHRGDAGRPDEAADDLGVLDPVCHGSVPFYGQSIGSGTRDERSPVSLPLDHPTD